MNMNESQARDAARREYMSKFTWHDDAVIAAYVEENWRRFASEKPAMTISPADDEQIAAMEECLDGRTVWGDEPIARLIARIRAEKAVLDEEYAFYSSTQHGALDGIPFEHVAHVIDVMRSRIRSKRSQS